MTAKVKKKSGKQQIYTKSSGYELIGNSVLNKGLTFTDEERKELKLRGLLPAATLTLDQEVDKYYNILKNKNDNLERHVYLRFLQDSNETVFYALVDKYLGDMLPLLYTPTVGEACQKFSQIYERPRGLFITYNDRHHIDEILDHERFDSIEVIVVTDGSRILGLGDLGACGMGIPIGKLSLYTACAGIPPHKTLPITLDAGTNNETLLKDPLYIGWRHPRITDSEYDKFIALFVKAITKRFLNVLLQWEDFAKNTALKLLNRYQTKLCSFNDDIQGTAAVTVGALLAATNATNMILVQHRIVIVGGGSAGVGISNLLVDAMMVSGMDREETLKNIFLVGRNGLITDRTGALDFQKPFMKTVATLDSWKIVDSNNITLLETITNTKATILIGVCAQGGIFTRPIIEQLAANCRRPIIFPLSNPTSKTEAHPHDILAWTHGSAIVGTGSPFPAYRTGNRQRRIDQINNCYVFPGLGLGVRAVKAKYIPDRLFLVAACALADISPIKTDNNGNLLPSVQDIRYISRHIALAVAKYIAAAKLTTMKNLTDENITKLIDEYMWQPQYITYCKKSVKKR